MATESFTGKTFGPYFVEERLGFGGMGVVYRARHVKLERTAAIKFIASQYAQSTEFRDRFISEARNSSNIDHANVIKVYDFGEQHGQLYLAMEFLKGFSLEAKLKQEGRLSLDPSVAIVKQVARGLGAAHSTGVIHRDLKPSNIFLVPQTGAKEKVKILDFGVAKAFGQGGPAHLTTPGMLLGTPAYMSPDQIQGEPTPASDFYSLGVIFYRMLCGELPFAVTNDAQFLIAHLHEVPIPISTRVPEVSLPSGLEGFVMRCLEKSPQKRFRDSTEFLQALDSVLPIGPVKLDVVPEPGRARAEDLLKTPPPTVVIDTPPQPAPRATSPAGARDVAPEVHKPAWRIGLPRFAALVLGLSLLAAFPGGRSGTRPDTRPSSSTEPGPVLKPSAQLTRNRIPTEPASSDSQARRGESPVKPEPELLRPSPRVLGREPSLLLPKPRPGPPRVMVLVEGNLSREGRAISSSEISAAAETKLFEVLQEKGIEFVDASTARANLDREFALRAIQGDKEAAARLGWLQKVDLIILGEAVAVDRNVGPGVISSSGNIRLRVVRAGSAITLADVQDEQIGYGADPLTAGTLAVKNATLSVADKVAAEIAAYEKAGSETVAIELEVGNLDSLSAIAPVERWLRESGATEVFHRGFSEGVVRIQVVIPTDAHSLAAALETTVFGKLRLDIVEVGVNKVEARARR